MLARCLGHLEDQGADQVLVVDASDDDPSQAVVSRSSWATYVDFRGHRNQMPASRNLGIVRATGAIVAFLDDDSLAYPGWLEALLGAFDDAQVGCAGGRAIDPTEPTLADPTLVGRLLADGTRIDNFNADPGRRLEVDRVRGCNMAFRRDLLVRLCGFDRAYTGSNVNEAGDMCLRVKRAGYKVVYEPRAVVDHVAAPREEIPRDPAARATQYYLARNRAYLLLKSLGPTLAVLRTLYLEEPGAVLARLWSPPSPGLAWVAAHLLGKLTGTLASMAPRRTGLLDGSWPAA